MTYGFYQREHKGDRLSRPSENGVAQLLFVSAIKSTDGQVPPQ